MLHARYATLLRPPGPGAVPKDGIIEMGFNEGTAPSGHHAWGWVDYNRYLTDRELEDYDMEYVHSITCTD